MRWIVHPPAAQGAQPLEARSHAAQFPAFRSSSVGAVYRARHHRRDRARPGRPPPGRSSPCFGVFGLAVSLAVKDSLGEPGGRHVGALYQAVRARRLCPTSTGNEGTVEEIRLNYTDPAAPSTTRSCTSPTATWPRRRSSTSPAGPTRRLDLVFSIGYGDDFESGQADSFRGAHRRTTRSRTGDPAPVVRMVRARRLRDQDRLPRLGRDTTRLLDAQLRPARGGRSGGSTRRASRSPTTRWTFICTGRGGKTDSFKGKDRRGNAPAVLFVPTAYICHDSCFSSPKAYSQQRITSLFNDIPCSCAIFSNSWSIFLGIRNVLLTCSGFVT